MPWDAVNKASAVAPKEYDALEKLTLSMMNFKCDRCQETFGAIGSWDNTRAIVLDSISGLNTVIKSSVVGSSIACTLPQFGAAQTLLLSVIQHMLQSRAHFVCLAHLTRTSDDLGAIHTTTDLIGQKLGSAFPNRFDEVYFPYKTDKGFFWSLNHSKVATKSRLVGFKEQLDIPQDFGPLLARWRRLNLPVGHHFLIHGDPGTGKSWSVGTLLKVGIEPFVFLTESAEATYHMLDPV
jgi:hypothetical protein